MDNEYLKERKQIAANITRYRSEKNLSKPKLSEMIDVDDSHIRKIESAASYPSLDVIFAISEVLDVPAYKFFEMEGE